MKLFSTILFCSLFSTAASASVYDLFQGQAINNICKNVTLEIPGEPGKWVDHEPVFALDKKTETLYVAQSKFGSNGRVWILSSISQDSRDLLIFLKDYSERIHGLEVVGEKLWVLFRDRFEVLNPATGEMLFTSTTHPEASGADKHHRAYDIASHGDSVYIAHGALGLVQLSAENGKLQYIEQFGLYDQPGGHRSKVMSIAINDGIGVLGVDHMTPPNNDSRALNGLIRFSLEKMADHTKHQYDPKPNKAGVIAYARMELEQGRLYINNLGNLQLFNAKGLDRLIVPKWRRLGIELYGKDRNIRPHGDIVIENDKVYGCGSVYLGDIEDQPELISLPIQGQ